MTTGSMRNGSFGSYAASSKRTWFRGTMANLALTAICLPLDFLKRPRSSCRSSPTAVRSNRPPLVVQTHRFHALIDHLNGVGSAPGATTKSTPAAAAARRTKPDRFPDRHADIRCRRSVERGYAMRRGRYQVSNCCIQALPQRKPDAGDCAARSFIRTAACLVSPTAAPECGEDGLPASTITVSVSVKKAVIPRACAINRTGGAACPMFGSKASGSFFKSVPKRVRRDGLAGVAAAPDRACTRRIVRAVKARKRQSIRVGNMYEFYFTQI